MLGEISKAKNGTSIFCGAAESCGLVQHSSEQEKNPPASLREERLRVPPLEGSSEAGRTHKARSRIESTAVNVGGTTTYTHSALSSFYKA